MRITGGRHRRRGLDAPPGRAVRPTTDRVREAVFNALAHGDWRDPEAEDESPAGRADPLDGARVLDAFAGTGAMALEALSRGAASAVLMEVAGPVAALARANTAALGEEARARVLRADATRPPAPRPGEAADLVFLDPPYGRDLVAPALAALARAGWIEAGALVAIETDRRDPEPAADGLTVLDRRRYGDTAITYARWRG
ncbi:MAG: RsmD family RNA methyltransferase [Azospirillaceae bacterium]